jgi:hypothetical protein
VLPCPAHAAANDDRRADIPRSSHDEAAPARRQAEQVESRQADRAFRAMLARVTGGIATIGDIVPGEQGHSCQVNTKVADAPYVGPDEWLKAAPRIEGSW